MNYYLLVLRILHIAGGIIWVGSVLVLFSNINPALKENGGSGQKFVDYLIKNKHFGTQSSGAGVLAGIAGLLLFWHDSQGLTSAWMHSSAGIGFLVGALFGLIGFTFGILTDRKLKAMAELREQLESTPSNEQKSQLELLGRQQTTYLNICAITLVLAVWIMAVARYLVF